MLSSSSSLILPFWFLTPTPPPAFRLSEGSWHPGRPDGSGRCSFVFRPGCPPHLEAMGHHPRPERVCQVQWRKGKGQVGDCEFKCCPQYDTMEHQIYGILFIPLKIYCLGVCIVSLTPFKNTKCCDLRLMIKLWIMTLFLFCVPFSRLTIPCTKAPPPRSQTWHTEGTEHSDNVEKRITISGVFL